MKKELTRFNEIYISADIEADGRIPARNSMLSFGLAAFTINKDLIGTFERNLKTLPNTVQDKETMEFWSYNQTAWNACRKNTVDPKQAMLNCHAWLKNIKKEYQMPTTLLGYPGGFDFQWINWYLHYFVGDNPCGWSVFCLKSYVASVLKCDFRSSAKRNFPKHWFEKGLPHTHIAIDDAIEQGALAINIIREVRGLRPVEKVNDLR